MHYVEMRVDAYHEQCTSCDLCTAGLSPVQQGLLLYVNKNLAGLSSSNCMYLEPSICTHI